MSDTIFVVMIQAHGPDGTVIPKAVCAFAEEGHAKAHAKAIEEQTAKFPPGLKCYVGEAPLAYARLQ